MSARLLRCVFACWALGAVAVSAACNSSSSSSSVAPVPVHSNGPSPTPSGSPSPTPHPTRTPSPSPTPTRTPPPTPTPSVTPTPTGTPNCNGSNTSTQPLLPSGGTLTLPPICTFTGTIQYATNNAPSGMTITFTTSVQNVFGVPSPNGGTPIMYTRTELGTSQGQSVKFDSCTSCTATNTSTTLLPSQTYALCAYIGQSFVIQQNPDVIGSPVGDTLTYQSPLTAEGLKALNGFLPTGVNIDTVLTQGVPSSCVPAARAKHR